MAYEEIATADHTHGLGDNVLSTYIDSTDPYMSKNGIPYNKFVIKSLRTQTNAPDWSIGNFSAGIAFGGADTKGVITHRYDYGEVKFAGGSADVANWSFSLRGSPRKTYLLDKFPNVLHQGLTPEGFSFSLANDGGIYQILFVSYDKTAIYNAYCVNNSVFLDRVDAGDWDTVYLNNVSVTNTYTLNFSFKGWVSYAVTKFVQWNAPDEGI